MKSKKITAKIPQVLKFVAVVFGLWLSALGIEYAIHGSIYMSERPTSNPLTVYFSNTGKIAADIKIGVICFKVVKELPDGRIIFEKYFYSDNAKISPQMPVAWIFKDAGEFFVYPRPDSIPLYAIKIKWSYDSFLPAIIPLISNGSDSLWMIYDNNFKLWKDAVIKQEPYLRKVIETFNEKK